MERWKKLSIIINEDSKINGRGLHHELISHLKKWNVKGMTAYRGIEGFGETKRLHSSKAFDISDSLPIVIEVVDEAEILMKLIPEIKEMIVEGIVYLSDVEIISMGKGTGSLK